MSQYAVTRDYSKFEWHLRGQTSGQPLTASPIKKLASFKSCLWCQGSISQLCPRGLGGANLLTQLEFTVSFLALQPPWLQLVATLRNGSLTQENFGFTRYFSSLGFSLQVSDLGLDWANSYFGFGQKSSSHKSSGSFAKRIFVRFLLPLSYKSGQDF